MRDIHEKNYRFRPIMTKANNRNSIVILENVPIIMKKWMNFDYSNKAILHNHFNFLEFNDKIRRWIKKS